MQPPIESEEVKAPVEQQPTAEQRDENDHTSVELPISNEQFNDGYHENASEEIPCSYDGNQEEAGFYEEREGEGYEGDYIVDEEDDQEEDIMDEEENVDESFIGEEDGDVDVEGNEDISHNYESDGPPRKQPKMFMEEHPGLEEHQQFQEV